MGYDGEVKIKTRVDNSGVTKGFGEVKKELLGIAAQAVAIQKAFQVVTKGIQFNAMAEQAEVSFGVMLGSAKKAREMVQGIRDDAASTPMTFTELQGAAKQLLAMGVNAENVRATMMMLGDVASGVGSNIGDISYLFGQVVSQGRAMTQDLNQFASRGIPMYDTLATMLGKSVTEIRAMAANGQITSDLVTRAFQQMTGAGGKFNGMMKAQSVTFEGLLSTLQDNLDAMLGGMTKDLMPALKDGISEFAKTMEMLGPKIEKIGTMMAGAASIVLDVFKVVAGIVSILPDQVLAIGAALLVAAGSAKLFGASLGGWGIAISAAVAGVALLVGELQKAQKIQTDMAAQAITESGLGASLSPEGLQDYAKWLSKVSDYIYQFKNQLADQPEKIGEVSKYMADYFKTSEEAILRLIIADGRYTAQVQSGAMRRLQAVQREQAASSDLIRSADARIQGIARAEQSMRDSAAAAEAQRLIIDGINKTLSTEISLQETLFGQTDKGADAQESYYEAKIKARQNAIESATEELRNGRITAAQWAVINSAQTAQIKKYEDELARLEKLRELSANAGAETEAERLANLERMLAEIQHLNDETEYRNKLATEPSVEQRALEDIYNQERLNALLAEQNILIAIANKSSPMDNITSGADKAIEKLQTVLSVTQSILGAMGNLEGEAGDFFSSLDGFIGTLSDAIGSGDPLTAAITALTYVVTTWIDELTDLSNRLEAAEAQALEAGSGSYLNDLRKQYATGAEKRKFDYSDAIAAANEYYSTEIENAKMIMGNTLYTLAEREAAMKAYLQLVQDQATAIAIIDANYALSSNAALASVTDSYNSFIDSLDDIGKNIAETLIDSLVNGLDNDDFLYAMQEYIRSAVISAAVYSDSLKGQIASIGAALQAAIISGADEDTLAVIRAQLDALMTEASASAQIASDIVDGVFSSYDVGTLSVPKDQIAGVHKGETILTAGLSQEARTNGIYMGPIGNLTGGGLSSGSYGRNSVSISVDQPIQVDGREIGRVSWEYQDEFAQAAGVS